MDRKKKLLPIASGWRRYMYVDPPVFLLMLSLSMTDTVFTELMIFLNCQMLYSTNKTICDILHSNSTSDEAMNLVKTVQPNASYIILVNSLISGIIPASLVLFLGPWSDKFGRKPLLIAGHLAPIIYYIIMIFLYQCVANPWMYLIASVPGSLCGGTEGGFIALFSFISDITNNEERSAHMACTSAFLTSGMIIGTMIGPLILSQFGYTLLFIIATIITICALIYIIIFVPETVQNKKKKWGNPFDFHLVKQLFEAPIKKRPGLNRYVLWCCILTICLLSMIDEGSNSIAYLFVNARLGWNLVQYSTFRSLSMALTAICAILGLKLMKNCFGLSDVIVALIGCTLNFVTSIIRSYTFKPWHLYLAASVDLLGGAAGPSIQSILTTSVPADDTGKIFSLITFITASLPIAGASFYTLIYTNFMPPVYPSPVYLLSAGLLIVMMLPLICIHWKQIKFHPIPQTINPDE